MELEQRLHRVARRLVADDQDMRNTLLDVSDDFLALADDPAQFPDGLRDEVAAIARELAAVQPRFRSHRQTSVLFDREGLGAAGRKRAQGLAQRIVALYKAVRRASRTEESD